MKAKRVKKLDPRKPLRDNAARIIRVRLGEMRAFSPGALQVDGKRDQHDMRIAAKRLRYVLEATEFCFGRPAQVARRRARDLQDVLGELHDCDVMLPRVERHLARLREADAVAVQERAADSTDLHPALAALAPHRTAYRGLETLIVYLQARRRLLFDRFTDFWAEQERAGTWGRLEREMRRPRRARDGRLAAERAERARPKLEAAERADGSPAAGAAAEPHETRHAASGRVPRPSGDPPPRVQGPRSAR